MKPDNTGKEARRCVIVTDMGTGSTYCSLCKEDLDYHHKNPYLITVCPNCNATFVGNEDPYINWGGSDF